MEIYIEHAIAFYLMKLTNKIISNWDIIYIYEHICNNMNGIWLFFHNDIYFIVYVIIININNRNSYWYGHANDQVFRINSVEHISLLSLCHLASNVKLAQQNGWPVNFAYHRAKIIHYILYMILYACIIFSKHAPWCLILAIVVVCAHLYTINICVQYVHHNLRIIIIHIGWKERELKKKQHKIEL